MSLSSSNTIELINWKPMYEEIEEIIKSENKNKNPKIAAFSWTEAGQFSSLMKNKYQTLVLDTDPHHFSYLEKNKNKKGSTYLLKISLGNKPDIDFILNRIKKYDKNAYHLKSFIISRGHRHYATGSLFHLIQ